MILLKKGKIWNGKDFNDALLIDGDRIAFMGSEEELMPEESWEVIDLEGRLVLPGFIDSHTHGGYFPAIYREGFSLYDAKSVDKYAEIIRRHVSENPDAKFIKGAGWGSALFGEDGPDKAILDEICPDIPMAIQAAEGHAYWVNSKLLEMAGVDANTSDPRGGKIFRNEDGSPRGCLADEAMELVADQVPDCSVEAYKETIMEYQQDMIKLGITSYGELLVREGGNLQKAYRELAEEGRLLIKAVMHYHVKPTCMEADLESLGSAERVISGKLVDGSFAKMFTDGALENYTAALKEDYSNYPGVKGELLWDDDKLTESCLKLAEKDYNIHIHCIGDRAVCQAVDAYEAMRKETGKGNLAVIAHVQLADKADMARMTGNGIMVSANPYWFFRDEVYTVENEIPALGERVDSQYPMKTLVDAGVIVSNSSDYPITAWPYPLAAMKYGMQRVYHTMPGTDTTTLMIPEERVGFDEMLDCITVNGAKTLGIDDVTGTLDEAMLADLVVLDKDIFEISPDDYPDVKVDMTFSEGELVYKR